MSAESAVRTRGRVSFVAAGVVLVLVALAGVVALIGALTRGPERSDPVGAAPTPEASYRPSVDDRSVCGLSGFDADDSLSGPPEVDWEIVGTVATPSPDAGSGPGVVGATGRSCFAHTAEGALFAAVNFVALSTDARTRPTLWRMIAAGPARDAAQAAAEGGGSELPAPADSASRVQVAGFRVDDYSPREATIDVVWKITSRDDSLVSVPTVLTWEGGDWKVVMTETGPPLSPAALSSLSGYTPWQGV